MHDYSYSMLFYDRLVIKRMHACTYIFPQQERHCMCAYKRIAKCLTRKYNVL